MGGPTTSLLLPNKLSETQIAGIEADLLKISSEVVKSEIWDWEFWVNSTRSIGGSYFGGGEPFGLSIETPEREAEDLTVLENELGLVPQQRLQFDAMCNGKEDRVIMGELVLHFATLFDGIVDFGGALMPPLPAHMYEDMWLWEKAQWADVESYVRQMLDPIPGKIVSIEYYTPNGRTWAYHVADATFLKAWLKHPHFHMIK